MAEPCWPRNRIWGTEPSVPSGTILPVTIRRMSFQQQADLGKLVCPDTGRRLVFSSDLGSLETQDHATTFDVVSGVPILLPAPLRRESAHGGIEGAAYHPDTTTSWRHRVDRFFERFGDHRSVEAEEAFQRFIGEARPGRLFLSVGGGPRRRHPALVTLNIARCANVDVVGDAHRLPYADDAVDGIECEAVLEHLESPDRAVSEFLRVLRPGGAVYAVTPFLQKYHGYPGHYQNFTLQGHRFLFERAGFEVQVAGVCVGPAWAITDLATEFVSQLVPVRGLRAAAVILARVASVPIRMLDRFLNRRPASEALASTTFVLGRKPG